MKIEFRRCSGWDNPRDPAAGIPLTVKDSLAVFHFLCGKHVISFSGMGSDMVGFGFHDRSGLQIVVRGIHIRVVLQDPPT